MGHNIGDTPKTNPAMSANGTPEAGKSIDMKTPVGDFNLSDSIEFELTEEGRAVLAASDYAHHLNQKREDGKTSMQFWAFALVFGKSMATGEANVITGNGFTLMRDKTVEEIREELALPKSVAGKVEGILK